jgi:predicted DNA-binding transcriptional regulator AlpA
MVVDRPYLVRLADVVRMTGLSRPTILRILRENRAKIPRVVLPGMKYGYYQIDAVRELFNIKRKERDHAVRQDRSE